MARPDDDRPSKLETVYRVPVEAAIASLQAGHRRQLAKDVRALQEMGEKRAMHYICVVARTTLGPPPGPVSTVQDAQDLAAAAVAYGLERKIDLRYAHVAEAIQSVTLRPLPERLPTRQELMYAWLLVAAYAADARPDRFAAVLDDIPEVVATYPEHTDPD